jgi:predicted RecA/RadA family phage recombinase
VAKVAKVSAQAWTEGLKIYWDNTAKLFTSTASTNPLVGFATRVAANPTATGYVRLDGVVR